MTATRRRLRVDPLEDRTVPATLSTFLTTQHVDLAIGYTRATDAWALSLNDADAGATYAPADALLYAGTPAKEARPAAAGFAFLGVGPGADYYRLPESQAVDRLYAGFAATGVTPADFNRYNPLSESKGRVGGTGRWLKVSLADVTHTTPAGAPGAGRFAVWQSGDTAPKVLMASHDDGVANPDGAGLDATDGITADDAVWVLAGSHSHYNFGFSEPGRYEVKVKLSGNVNTDGNADSLEVVSQSGETTLYFSVASVGQVSFATAPQAPEGGGSKTVTVTRTGGSDGRITVNYGTSNGTAAAPGDYTAASGTLTFNDGETSKTFAVPVVDDQLDEADETVNLTLSNPGPAGINNYLKDHQADANGLLGTTATATLTILDDDSPPTVSDVADQTIDEDTATAALAVTVGDAQTPAASLTLSAASSNPALVPVSNVVFGGGGANRTVTVTPAANLSGTATITLTVTDAGGLTATDTFAVTVNAVNDAPTVSDVPNQSTDEDTALGPIAVTVGDVETAAAGLTLTAASSDQALIPDGNIVIGGSGADRTVTVTPAANASGTATVTLTVTDGNGGTATDTFVLTVNAVNDAPTVSDVADQIFDEDTLTAALAVTVGDAETAAAGLTLTAASTDQALIPDGNIVIGGSGADRTVTVTPVANRSGTATITLTVTDAGGKMATDTFIFTVDPVNDAPTISDVGDQTVDEDTPTAALPVTVGDLEMSAGGLTLTAESSDQALIPDGNIVFAGSGANRTVTVTPAANLSGTATVTVTVTDAGGLTATDTFTVTVTAVNDAPAVSDVPAQTTPLDTPLGPVPFVVADADHPAGGLTVTAASSDQSLIPDGNISLGGSGGNRTVTVTPAAGQTGTATITLTVTDGAGATAADTFTVAVGVTPPTVSDVADQTTAEDTPTAAVPFTIGDAETPAAALTVIAASSDQALIPDGNIVIGGSGADRTVTVTPAANASGTATVTLTVTDGNGGTATDTFVLTVNAVNDAPTVSDVADQIVDEDTPTAALAVTVGDAETAAAGLTLTAASSDQTLIPDGNIVVGGSGANRTVTVTPAANRSGTATITLTVTDGNGATATDTFTVTVTAANDIPTVSDVPAQTTDEDAPLGPVAVTVGDAETPAGSLTLAAVSSDQTLIPDGNIVIGGSGASLTVTVTPAANRSGTATITLTVTDAAGATATDTFVVTVAAVNDAPTLSPVPNQVVKEDEPTPALAVTVGDVETPAAGLALSAASSNPSLVPVGNVAFGGSGASRTVTVTPAAGQFGVATITVSVTDAEGGTAAQSFTVTVSDQAAPVAAADAVVVSPGNIVRGNVLANDADADGDALTTAVAANPLHGAVALSAAGSFTYTPGPTFAGSDTFQYTATDATGRTATGTVSVAAAGTQVFEAVLTEGHTDIGLAYEDDAWDLHVHAEDTDTEYEPAGALLHVGADTQTPRPAGAAFDFLGVAAGDNYYRLAQSAVGGQLLLGFGAEEIAEGTFEGDGVALTLKAVNGPGHFSIWKSEIAGPVVAMATTDGVSAADRLTVPAGSHGDFNFGFSAKGRYEVTFEASAILTGGTAPTTSGDVTYYFSVDSLGRIAFDPVTYGVKEGATTTLTVRRTGGSDGPATVAYAAVPQTPVNGRAVAGKASAADFTMPAGTLAFADGETVKTITFTAKTDRLAEPVETVPVVLTVPADSFAQLGAAATATVTIDTTTALLVKSVRFNDGLAQRSNLESVSITFSRDTNVLALIASGRITDAVKIHNTTTNAPVPLTAARYFYHPATRTLTVGLTQAGFDPRSLTVLADGRHEVRLDTALLTSGAGTVRLTDNDTVKTDGVRRTAFHRLLGDFNGDRKVNATDVALMNARLNSFVWQRKYLYAFDLTGPLSAPDGVIDLTDMTYLKTSLLNRKLV